MIRMIVAVDDKFGIAKQGSIPWDIPSDRRFFSEQTKLYGGLLLAGRTTYQQLNGSLPSRHLIAATSHSIDGADTTTDIDAYLSSLNQDIWIIGGGKVYASALAYADELYITHVKGTYGCDTFFPQFQGAFEIKEKQPLQEENGYQYQIIVYARTK